MRSNYRKLGEYIELVKDLNHEIKYGESDVRGVSNNKKIIKTKANNKGRDFSKFYIVAPNDFIYNSRTSRMGDKVGLGYNDSGNTFITSFNNTAFRVKNEKLLPTYLFMWFNRSEFDRYARYHSWGSSTELFSWEGMCDVELPVPSIEKQREMVREYNVVNNRIALNEKLTQKLEDTAQAIYKQWFVDFEFPISKEYAEFIGKPEQEGKPYKSSGGEMEYCEQIEEEIPLNWDFSALSSQAEVIMGQSPSGEHLSTNSSGTVFYQGRTDFNFRFPSIRVYTSLVKRLAQPKDVLMSVRAPVGDVNISSENCAIGRGIAAIRDKCGINSFIYYSLQNLSRVFNIADGEGTIFGSINKDELNELSVIFPNIKTKEEFNHIVGHIDSMIEVVEKELVSLRSIRTLINAKMSKG